MSELHISWPWLSLIAMGGFHGLNPAMGWLFAVAIGFQERRFRAVVKALGPITLGHALSIAMIAVPVGLLGLVIPRSLLLIAIGVVLLSFAAYKIASRFRHPRWVGMRLRSRELVLWSFLMATAHGAGLMLAPVLTGMRDDHRQPDELAQMGGLSQMDHMTHMTHASHLSNTGHATHMAAMSGDALGPAVIAVALHSAAMLVVAGVIATVVYRKIGVEMLRRAWINLDLIWVSAFVIAGTVTLGFGAWSYIA